MKGGRPGRKADKFTAICEPTVYKMWEALTTLWTYHSTPNSLNIQTALLNNLSNTRR
jgi:hypothetical protein